MTIPIKPAVTTGTKSATEKPSLDALFNVQFGGMTRLAKVNWTVLLWAIGIPLPLVGIVALMRGCS